ncbi:hypothetical protein D3C80_1743600 [compost metagenome]
MQAGDAALVVQHQQGFRQVEAEVRATLILAQCRQIFETGDQVIGKQAAEHDRFTFVSRGVNQCQQSAQRVKY